MGSYGSNVFARLAHVGSLLQNCARISGAIFIILKSRLGIELFSLGSYMQGVARLWSQVFREVKYYTFIYNIYLFIYLIKVWSPWRRTARSFARLSSISRRRLATSAAVSLLVSIQRKIPLGISFARALLPIRDVSRKQRKTAKRTQVGKIYFIFYLIIRYVFFV